MKQRADLYFRKAAARPERYELSDRDGLVMEVHPLGGKTWCYRYRLNGKREKMTLAARDLGFLPVIPLLILIETTKGKKCEKCR